MTSFLSMPQELDGGNAICSFPWETGRSKALVSQLGLVWEGKLKRTWRSQTLLSWAVRCANASRKLSLHICQSVAAAAMASVASPSPDIWRRMFHASRAGEGRVASALGGGCPALEQVCSGGVRAGAFAVLWPSCGSRAHGQPHLC